MHPDVFVVGTGSVGRRHIRNLVALGASVSAYSYRGLTGVPDVAGVRMAAGIDEGLAAGPRAVVVANATDRHMEVALAAARRGCDLFIEKPLSNSLGGVADLARAAASAGLVVETGFMLRFHPNVQWMKRFLDGGGAGPLRYVRALFGQYLPDWRPGTDYRQCYSARRGVGGVIFDQVHDLDLVAWLAGPIADVSATIAQSPLLEIESESIADVNVRFRSGALGHVHLDCVRPAHARTYEIVGDEAIVTWDYVSGTVHVTDRSGDRRLVHEVSNGFERNDMFVTYMRYFLDRLSNRALPAAASLADGVAALRTALACHQSARERRAVEPQAVAESFSPVEAAL